MVQKQYKRSEKSSYDKQTAVGTTGMVVSPHPVATEIGKKVLIDGGNAVDAAVAIQFALNVTEPMMTGVGGSGFMMVYNRDSKTTKIFNGHSRAPQAAYPEMFVDEQGEIIPFRDRSTRGTAVAVPGILKAMDAALEEYGSKTMADLIDPSAKLAEEGMSVNWVMKKTLDNFHYRLGDEARKLYMPGGEPLREGDIVKKEHLAKTFRILQKEGIGCFYEGDIADAIISTVKEQGGFMTHSDLKSYRISIDEPAWGDYKGHKIASCNVPSAGGTTLLNILKLLETFNIEQYSPKSWEKYYLFTEAMRIAFADKVSYFGDPDFVDMPLKGLTSEEYIEERRKLLNFERRNDAVDFGNPWKYDSVKEQTVVRQPFEKERERSETTHFTVTDQWGNIVSCTSTVEHPFGSGIMVKGYGFMLNNELTDFDAMPGGLNQAEPGKRPVSCKSPTIVFKDDDPVLTLGSPGGPTIIGSVFETIVNVIDFKMELKDAIEEPRIFNANGPLIWWEGGIDMEAKGNLEAMGYEFADDALVIGNVQAIQFDRENNRIYGAADSSREGGAIGLEG
ncbi:gamma-glutamyltransferase [Mesobacillus harenae]|uniref:gamma-glutamyltransferase n=1 Tax=Mesobacillus harenae TaxID=2213203 RepID=UPI0015801E5F|nr:gamma-glutamyltransferase [Mesobacillus harenae]